MGHYELRGKLGAGGMGEVYLADDTRLHRKVAIKFLPAESTADPHAKRRLLREAQAAAALDHPNICAIHEVGEVEGRAFIVMQYVEGETLATCLQRSALPRKPALDIAVAIADALAEAHSRGVIHRDIKPANIMLTSRGQVKILDFGLARVIAHDDASVREHATQTLLTEVGSVAGTVPYMSPEQIKGEALDVRTDIFSFGVVLYEMLTGRMPFAAKTRPEIVAAILTAEAPPLTTSAGEVDSALGQIVRKCLAKDRDRRYQTMREVMSVLEMAPKTAGRLFPVPPRKAIVAALVIAGLAAASYALLPRLRSLPASRESAVNSPAYDYYMRGKLRASNENPESNDSAIKLLQQAIAADPTFAPAYTELARAYHIKAFYFVGGEQGKQLNEDAALTLEKALRLDPNLADAHFVRGLLLWTHDNRFPHDQTVQSYKRALELNPKLDEARHQLGLVYLHIGLLDKAAREIEQAVALNPANLLARFRFGVISLYRTNYEDALDIFKSTPLGRNPSINAFQTATALFQLGRSEEAATLLNDYLQKYPKDEGGVGTSVRAMMLAKAGKTRDAEDAIQRSLQIGSGFGHFHHTAYNVASAYALMNDSAQAMNWLQVAADDGFPCYPLFLKDTNLNSLRTDERFIKFMAQLKQRWERYDATM